GGRIDLERRHPLRRRRHLVFDDGTNEVVAIPGAVGWAAGPSGPQRGVLFEQLALGVEVRERVALLEAHAQPTLGGVAFHLVPPAREGALNRRRGRDGEDGALRLRVRVGPVADVSHCSLLRRRDVPRASHGTPKSRRRPPASPPAATAHPPRPGCACGPPCTPAPESGPTGRRALERRARGPSATATAPSG